MKIPRLPSGYRVRFADEGHQPIKNWEQFKDRWGSAIAALYFKGVLIGSGTLTGGNGRIKRVVRTHDMALRQEFRRKGHGIWLYLAVLRAAQKLGADEIWSSYSLNKFSRRMWSEKLAKLFKVYRRGGGCLCGRHGRYFIRLKENS